MIIAYAGKKGAGKSYIANVIASQHNGVVMSFAEALRVECIEYTYFNVFTDAKDLPIVHANYRAAGTLVLMDNPQIKTNRDFMIHIANYRKQISPSWYTDKLIERVRDNTQLVIIDDLRFPYEFDALNALKKLMKVFFIGSITTNEGADPSEDVNKLFKHVSSIAPAYLMMGKDG